MSTEILKVIQEMRERKVNHGRDTSPTLEAWADRLEAALSQQAEPECRCAMRQRLVGDGCAVCNPEYAADHEAEPAPAQDEMITRNQAIAEAFREGVEWQRNRPAQTEQQPVAYADPQAFVNFDKARQEGIEAGPRTHEWMWANPGSCLAPLYAAPIAQTEQQDQSCDYAGCCNRAHPGTSLCFDHHSPKARKAMLEGQTAPQPEQEKAV